MVSKYNLTSKLQMAYKKYCNGEYTFDQDVSKNGKFQLALIKVSRNVILNPNGYKDKNPMLDFLVNQTMDYIA
jgi:hypothetical protein